MLDVESRQILATAHAPGSTNDLTLFRTYNPHLQSSIWVVADGGYQGLAADHPQCDLPVKKPRGGELCPADKAHNQALGRFRVTVEHTIRSLKIWRILKETYRKRFSLRFKLIAGLLNARLDA